MEPPENFGFPFPPYDIQNDFMRQLFQVLEGGKLGIFESPTGTGKSLSLICGTLSWLKCHEEKRIRDLEEQVKALGAASADDNADDWFAAAVKKKEEDEKRSEAKRELESLRLKESKIAELRRRRQSVKQSQIQKVDSDFDELFRDLVEVREAVKKELARNSNSKKGDFIPEDEEELVVEDYESDDDGETESRNPKFFQTLDDEEEEEAEDYSLRVFYCSRTHSQLSQFVREVQKTCFALDLRLVSLASRANLCINDSVTGLKLNHLINDRCLELQKKSSAGKATKVDAENLRATKRSKTESGCPFRKSQAVAAVRDQALLQVQDIEQLVSTGRQLKGCPYYGSRQAVGDAQVVIVPYNTLLHKPTRESIGIKLKNSVVIIDEAHNLLDTIAHIHSAEVRGDQLMLAYSQLSQYLERYRSRLKAKNLLYIKQILFILNNFLKLIGISVKQKAAANVEPSKVSPTSKLVSILDFLSDTEIFNLNLLKLIKYIEKSKIGFKLRGFSQRNFDVKNDKPVSTGVGAFLASLNKNADSSPTPAEKENVTTLETQPMTSSPIFVVDEFLRCLIDISSDGKILLSINPAYPAKSGIKYLLLNPAASHFGDLVAQCRAVVVAGGTMQPVDEFKEQLFVAAGGQHDRIVHFACGHVIPDENILPLVLTKGPTGRNLDFSYQFRDQTETLDELGRSLANICNMVPGGVICFFPSYDYEAFVYNYFQKNGVIDKLTGKKRVFREPKRTGLMDQVLKEYGKFAKMKDGPQNGALLFSVVGGKMSEGINFSDDLGRCVVMVGLPFPNSKSPEIKEKMDYLDKTVAVVAGRSAGQVYYENLCMKAVNQSIGRAIRHQKDYATILLLDHRYSRPNILSQLPLWIRKCLAVEEKFGPVMPKLKSFFRSKAFV